MNIYLIRTGEANFESIKATSFRVDGSGSLILVKIDWGETIVAAFASGGWMSVVEVEEAVIEEDSEEESE